MMRRLSPWMLLLPLFWASFGMGAQAQTVTCSSTFTTISFQSDLDILTSQNTQTFGLNARASCTGISVDQTVMFCMGLGPGENSTDSTVSRKMANASKTSFLAYNIFKASVSASSGLVWTSLDTDNPYATITAARTSKGISYYEADVFTNQSSTPVGTYTDKIKVYTHYYVINTTRGETLPASCAVTPAYATPAPYDLTVTATITPNCNISATSMTFDPQSIITADLLAQSALTVKCTNDPTNPIIPYISLDNGLHPASGQSQIQRQMENQTKPGNFISYDLYSDSQRSSPWGSNPGVNTVQIPRSASDTRIPVYGKIPKPPISPPAGTYTDRITATVNF